MMNRALLILLISLLSTPAWASPYVSPDLSVKIGEHRWGIWRVVDTPSHDPDVLAKTSWLSSGQPDEKPTIFRSYWVLGLGPFLALHVSQGTLLLVLMCIVMIVSTKVYLKRKEKTEPGAEGDG